MLDRVVDIETQFLEVGDDNIARVLVLALIAEGLPLDMAEVGGLVIFEFDDTDDLVVTEDSAICFLGIGLVLLLGDEVEVRRRVEGIAEDLHEEFAEEALLELLLFGRADIVLDLLVQEIRFVHFPCGCYLLSIERREVLLNDTILKKHGVIYLVEYSGLEPLTSTLPVLRSSQMS